MAASGAGLEPELNALGFEQPVAVAYGLLDPVVVAREAVVLVLSPAEDIPALCNLVAALDGGNVTLCGGDAGA